jgi:hypothetical protein
MSRLLIAIAIMGLAGLLRFYKLGDWPFAGDETATLAEEQSLFSGDEEETDSPTYRLPRIIPLSYVVHHVSNTFFGRDEFGSRVMMAILGTLSVGLVFVMLDGLRDRATAVATALLVALWPDHVFESQQTRFYIVVAFFAYLCLFVGAYAARERTTLHYVVLGCSVLLAILCHTLMSILLPIVFAGVTAAGFAEKRPWPKKMLSVFLGTLMVVVIFYGVYLKPLVSGWNSGATWRYSSIHSLFASLNMIGWPVILLATFGFLLMCKERNGQNWYWIVCVLGWLGATVGLPLLVSYHPGYVFPLAITVMVLAGSAIGTIYGHLRVRGFVIAATWVALASLSNLPSLASHYVDGSRPDMRSAADYVKRNWRNGDRIAGFAIGLFAHYAQGYGPFIPLSSTDAIQKLDQLANGTGRVWIVMQSGRSGLPEELRRWLGAHSTYELKVRHTRFDYADYSVEVYLYTPSRDPGMHRTQRQHHTGGMKRDRDSFFHIGANKR